MKLCPGCSVSLLPLPPVSVASQQVLFLPQSGRNEWSKVNWVVKFKGVPYINSGNVSILLFYLFVSRLMLCLSLGY